MKTAPIHQSMTGLFAFKYNLRHFATLRLSINIEGVFQSFDSNGVLLVPDPNQSQIRKGKTEMSSTWSTTL